MEDEIECVELDESGGKHEEEVGDEEIRIEESSGGCIERVDKGREDGK